MTKPRAATAAALRQGRQYFFVEGVPATKGSTRSFVNHKTGRVVTWADNRDKQKAWAEKIMLKAKQKQIKKADKAVAIEIKFHLPEPKSFRNAKGNRKPSAPKWHTKKPDLDKLIRCVLDALTGIAWNDDSQVVRIIARKDYSSVNNAVSNCGAFIEIESE